MNPSNGLVSPQFHVTHDEFFETIDRRDIEPMAPWKTLDGLRNVQQKELLQAQDTSKSSAWDNEYEQEDDDDKERTGDEPESEPVATISRRSGRIRQRTQALQDGIDQGLGITSFKSTIEEEEHDQYYEVLHEEDYKLQDEMFDPIAFKTTSNPDDMYYHQALKEPDKDQFLQAIVKEINDHIEGNHWQLIPKSEVPNGTKILDTVWAMKRKRDIKTREIYKYKARLNIHGGQQEYDIHYTDTYSPVVSWFSVRLLLILAKLNGYYTKQIDFVLAYPQADIPFDNYYMSLPKRITTKDGNKDTHVLKLNKNIYGGRNSGRVWNDYLKTGLENIGFEQSTSDECVYFRKDVIFFFYVDDGIFLSPNQGSINKAMADLMNTKKAKQKFKVDDQGDISYYLGINFDQLPDGSLKLWQPHLIQQILEELNINPREQLKTTPALSTRILRRCKDEAPIWPPFNYRKVIGQLNYLEKSSRPDIAYAVHQCTRFCSEPKEDHVKAVMHLGKYLQGTKEQGIIIKPDKQKSFEVDGWMLIIQVTGTKQQHNMMLAQPSLGQVM